MDAPRRRARLWAAACAAMAVAVAAVAVLLGAAWAFAAPATVGPVALAPSPTGDGPPTLIVQPDRAPIGARVRVTFTVHTATTPCSAVAITIYDKPVMDPNALFAPRMTTGRNCVASEWTIVPRAMPVSLQLVYAIAPFGRILAQTQFTVTGAVTTRPPTTKPATTAAPHTTAAATRSTKSSASRAVPGSTAVDDTATVAEAPPVVGAKAASSGGLGAGGMLWLGGGLLLFVVGLGGLVTWLWVSRRGEGA